MYCFDTNLIIYSAEPQYPALRTLLTASAGYISAITLVETLGFRHLTPAQHRYFENVLRLQRLLPVDDDVIQQAIRLRQQRNLKLGDALIAATAMLHGLTIATRNEKDFSGIAGLTVFNPLASNG